ncbi:hypothetical protein PMAYCL1PPCAC_17567, partial [Pristionchus mayeri]
CKTFFRRVIIAQREFECCREGKCTKNGTNYVSVDCRKCRFVKCCEVGMNPLAIVAVKEPQKNELIEKVVKRRRQTMHGSSETHHSQVDQIINIFIHPFKILDSPHVVELTMDRVIFEL